jgi:hypothetical protein
MYAYSLRGANATFAGKMLTFILVHQVVLPLIASLIGAASSSERARLLNEEIVKLKEALCINEKILSDEECAKLSEIPIQYFNKILENAVSYSDLSFLLGKTPEWNNLLFFTHIDEVWRFVVNDVLFQQTGTQEGITTDFWLSKFYEKAEELEDWASLGYDSDKSYEENLEAMKKAKGTSEIKQGENEKFGNIEVGGEKSFKAYCRSKGLTYISYTSGNVGTAKDGSGIQRDYIWDSDLNNWKEY